MASQIEVDQYLAHHGILGMKWGKRKSKVHAKSNRAITLEGRYIRKGSSLKEAERRAAKRIKIEKIVAITGAVTLAALAGYAVKQKIGRDFTKVELAKGTKLSHVFTPGLDPFSLSSKEMFTTFKAKDINDIHALFPKGSQLNLAAATNIKAPSNYEARKIFSNVIGAKHVVSPSTYADFNYQHYYSDAAKDKLIVKNFFEALQSKGYNAVLDPKPTGYAGGHRLHQPLIVLNAAKNLAVKGEQVVTEQMKKEAVSNLNYRDMIKLTAGTAVYGGAFTGLATSGLSSDRKQTIDKFYKANPKTKLNRSQVSSLVTYNYVSGQHEIVPNITKTRRK